MDAKCSFNIFFFVKVVCFLLMSLSHMKIAVSMINVLYLIMTLETEPKPHFSMCKHSYFFLSPTRFEIWKRFMILNLYQFFSSFLFDFPFFTLPWWLRLAYLHVIKCVRHSIVYQLIWITSTIKNFKSFFFFSCFSFSAVKSRNVAKGKQL